MTDDERLAALAQELADGLDEHLGRWMVETVERHGVTMDPPTAEAIRSEAVRICAEVRQLLETDVDRQWSNPLSLIRGSVESMTAALASAGVVRPTRDPDATRLHPDDVYDVAPASFSDVHPDLHLPGLSWGAAKAHIHLARRRAEDRR